MVDYADREGTPEVYVYRRWNPTTGNEEIIEAELGGWLVWETNGKTFSVYIVAGQNPYTTTFVDGTSGLKKGTVGGTIEPGERTRPVWPDVGALSLIPKATAKAIKGNYTGVAFTENGATLAAGLSWKIASTGKWSGSLAIDGRTTKLSGKTYVGESGAIVLETVAKTNFKLVLYPDKNIWVGSYDGLELYGRKADKLASDWAGVWTCGLVSMQDPTVGGYLKSKLTAKGKVSVSGKISASTSVSASTTGVLLDEAFLATYLPDWSGNGDVFFSVVSKLAARKPFTAGLAFCANGRVLGEVFNGSDRLAVVDGYGAIARFDPLALVGATVTCGDVVVPLVQKGRSVAPDANDVKFKFTVSSSTGVFKGSYKKDGVSYKFEGVLFPDEGGGMLGFGGGNAAKNGTFTVTITK